jgi:hypothetical protein
VRWLCPPDSQAGQRTFCRTGAAKPAASFSWLLTSDSFPLYSLYRKLTAYWPAVNSRIRISLYQASLGAPPWICRPTRPVCGIDSSGSV